MATIYAEVPSFSMMVPGVTRDLYPNFRDGAAKSQHVKVIQYAMTRDDLTIQLEPNEEYMYFPEAKAKIIFPNGQHAENGEPRHADLPPTKTAAVQVAEQAGPSDSWKTIVPTLTQEEVDALTQEIDPDALDLNTAPVNAAAATEEVLLCNICGKDFEGKTAKARYALHNKREHTVEES